MSDGASDHHRGPSAALLARLERTALISSAEYVARSASTNGELLARQGGAGMMLITDEQTAGRGRRGRQWFAPPGTSLMFSLALRPRLAGTARSLLPLLAGTALIAAVRTLVGEPGIGLGLKWPNDLLVDDVKAAGILAESHGELIVLGIGINVDWRDVDRPADLNATSLSEAVGRTIDRWALLEALTDRLDAELRSAERDPAAVVPRYVPSCVTIGRTVTATVGGRAVTGQAVGLSAEGHLRLRPTGGGDIIVSAGEVHHVR